MTVLRLLSRFSQKAFKKVFKGGDKVAILSSKITRFFPRKTAHRIKYFAYFCKCYFIRQSKPSVKLKHCNIGIYR